MQRCEGWLKDAKGGQCGQFGGSQAREFSGAGDTQDVQNTGPGFVPWLVDGEAGSYCQSLLAKVGKVRNPGPGRRLSKTQN